MEKGVRLARAAALCALLFFLGTAARLPVGDGEGKEEKTVYVYARSEAREREMAQLTALMENPLTGEKARERAEERLLFLLSAVDQEYIIEEILRLSGYEGAVCTVSDRNVTVLLPGGAISGAQAETIFALVMRETGQSGNNIKVIPLN